MKMKNTFAVFALISVLAISSAPLASADYTEGNDELLDALNAALGNIFESGDYDEIYGNWFSGAVVRTDDSDSNTATEFPDADSLTENGTLDQIISSGEIAFGSDTTYPPFEFIEGDDVIGFDAEIAEAIAAELSEAYDTTIVAVMQTNDWDPIIPDLQSGKFDAILSAMTKTDERDQEIDFTQSYYTSKQGILANADAPDVDGIDDLNDATISIAVQTGTTSDIYAEANLPDADLQGFTSFDLAVAALAAGDVDFLLGDLPVLAYYDVDNPSEGFDVVGAFGDEELFGIGVREEASSGLLPVPVLPMLAAFLALPLLARRLRK